MVSHSVRGGGERASVQVCCEGEVIHMQIREQCDVSASPMSHGVPTNIPS